MPHIWHLVACTHPSSEKKTLLAQLPPTSLRSFSAHSSAGSYTFSGNMTCPYRPAAWLIACAAQGCSSADMPCRASQRATLRAGTQGCHMAGVPNSRGNPLSSVQADIPHTSINLIIKTVE